MATAWTDPTIIPGETLVKRVHFTEMGTAINKETSRRRLGTSTPPSIGVGSYITTEYVTWLRNRINANFPSVGTDTLTSGSIIKAIHVSELRAKINALENNPNTYGAIDCKAACTGLCNNACTSCTSCTSCSGGCSGSCRGHCSHCSWLW